MKTKMDLTKTHTRRLLVMRNICFAEDAYETDTQIAYHEDIVAELNTREHVPNRAESRKARQEKGKQRSRRNK